MVYMGKLQGARGPVPHTWWRQWPWRYLVSFARYSDLFVENCEIFIPQLYLASPKMSRRCLIPIKLVKKL